MRFPLAVVVLTLSMLSACTTAAPDREIGASSLETMATSDRQWTGVAVSREGRVFVNFPRWSGDVPISVAELVDGEPVAYPDIGWNDWSPSRDPGDGFICVQSLHVDAANRLWILDPASPGFAGVVPGGAKLLQVDLLTDRVVRVFRFDETVAPHASYLNDVRIDVERNVAYMTDSGASALVVVDLATGHARRVLDHHLSTASEGIVLTIGEGPWMPDGEAPDVHADGIAWHAASDTVTYQALTGRTMYRVSGADLRDPTLSEDALARRVEIVGRTGASDGLIAGDDGSVYVSALEEDAILRVTPDGSVETIVRHPSIAWPDSFAWGADGWLWFTTARIHEGAEPSQPYGLHRVRVR